MTSTFAPVLAQPYSLLYRVLAAAEEDRVAVLLGLKTIRDVITIDYLRGLKPSSGGMSQRGPHRLMMSGGCERRWGLRFHNQITPRETSEAALLGTLIHLGLAYHYAELCPPEFKPAWLSERTLEEALHEIGEGYTREIATALEAVTYYKYVTAGEGFSPRYVEREFFATVGDVDPEGQDEDEIHYVSKDPDPLTGLLREFHAPRLNDEAVTCRSDVVGIEDGMFWIRDHKSKASEWWLRAFKDRLPPWKPDNEFQLNWQSLVNLKIVRHVLGFDKVAGFQINRIKRAAPFDRDCHKLDIPERPYEEVGQAIRKAVKDERTLALRLVKGERVAPRFWECTTPWPCDYLSLCKAQSKNVPQLIQLKYRKAA